MPDNHSGVLKKLADLRKRRRTEKRTNSFFQIEGNWSDLQQNFHDGYRQMLRQRSSSAECFHVLLNSLMNFYQRTTEEGCPEAEIKALVNGFLSKCFSKIFSDTTTSRLFEGNHWEQSSNVATDALYMDKQRLECEVRCMVEIYLLKSFPVPIHQTTVIQKLRSLYYASDPISMRKFLDETLCDEFIDDLPLYLAAIYEELLFDLPSDLVEFQSIEGREDDKQGAKTLLTERNRFVSQLEELFAIGASDGKEDETDSFSLSAETAPIFASTSSSRVISDERMQPPPPMVEGAPMKDRRNPKRKRDVLDPSHESPKAKLQQGNDPAQRTSRCRLINVPETPDEKITQKNRRLSMAAEMEDEVVEQTPIGKIKRGMNNNEDSRLGQLLKYEEEKMRFSTSQQTVNPSSLNGKASSVSTTESAAKLAPRGAQRRLKL